MSLARYAIYGPMASGGMAVVHYGRLLGPVGFSRVVAIKRLHPQMAADPEVASMFVDEARLASRIRHPNVVSTLDVVDSDGELLLVMEYVHGETLARAVSALRQTGERVPARVVSAILCGVLQGLHHAHEARSEAGQPLRIVHRDVSPQNVIVGTDGVVRLLDFGIAKAVDRIATTREGQIKGKIRYMSPEQLFGTGVDRATDIYAASVVLWELLCGERFYGDVEPPVIVTKLSSGAVEPPRNVLPELVPLVPIVMQGLSYVATERPRTALEMALAIEACVEPASATQVGAWIESLAGEALGKRTAQLARIEGGEEAPIGMVPKEAAPPSDASAAPVAREVRAEPPRRWPVAALFALACTATGVGVWQFTKQPASPAPQAQAATTPGAPTPISATSVAPPNGDPPPVTTPQVQTTASVATSAMAKSAARAATPHARHARVPRLDGLVRTVPFGEPSGEPAPTPSSAPTPAPAASSTGNEDLYGSRR